MKATCAKLQVAHRSLLQELMSDSQEERALAKAKAAGELLGVPPSSAVTLTPAITKRNLPSTEARSR